MKKILISFLALFFAGELSALSVTSAEFYGGGGDFVFSEAVLVGKIKFSRGFIKMPFDAYKKKKYGNIRLLSKKLNNEIVRFFKGLKTREVGKNKVKIVFESSRKLKSPKRVANVDISFDDDLIVTFGILDYDGKIRILYPKDFAIINPKLKAETENLIMKMFKKEKVKWE